jgi:hypothetical protein
LPNTARSQELEAEILAILDAASVASQPHDEN